jgi:Na+/proline symporter
MLDWGIIIGYNIFVLFVGIYFNKKASKDLDSFFLADRSLPWWIAGTSIVATTFAADTPLAITGLVAKHGIAGNWFWWCMVIGHVMAIFLFSKLWRRAKVLTDVELTEIRYDGRSAAVLRGFKGFYFGILINCFTMGWVINAMTKITGEAFGWDKLTAILICIVIAMGYSIMSGFWGVVITDIVQFALAMIGSISLAIYSYNHIGGIDNLKIKLGELYGQENTILDVVPNFTQSSAWMPFSLFFIFLSTLWWAHKWSDGGGGIVVQRLSATKNEKEAYKSVAWFTFAHYVLRSWPWVVVALVSLVVFPGLKDPELGYPKMMVKLLPSGLLGIMVTSLLAAFMSTIDTHLNWGSSYLVNDIYRRFINKDATMKHYILASRLGMVIIMIIASIITWQMDSISGAWKFIVAFGSGAGAVVILRWFWWRINAWSEISSLVASGVIASCLYIFFPETPLQVKLPIIVSGSAVIWIIATFLTRPTSENVLIKFYERVYPGGPLWKRISDKSNVTEKPMFKQDIMNWIWGVLAIYGSMFGIGKVILGNPILGFSLFGTSLIFFFLIIYNLGKEEKKKEQS